MDKPVDVASRDEMREETVKKKVKASKLGKTMTKKPEDPRVVAKKLPIDAKKSK